MPYSYLSSNKDFFYVISSIDLEHGVLEKYSFEERVDTIDLQGFLMQCVSDDEYTYVRSDIISTKNNEITSMLYIIDNNTFELEDKVILDKISQCKTMTMIKEKLYIGSIFKESNYIAIYETVKKELKYIELAIVKKSLKETIGFVMNDDIVYHIDRTGTIMKLDQLNNDIGSFYLEGDYIDAESLNGKLYLLSTNKNNRLECKVSLIDLKSEILERTITMDSKADLIPQSIYLKDGNDE